MMALLDKDELWRNVLSELQIQMRPEDFRTWFGRTGLVSYDGSTCVVGVENPFNVDWLTTKCSALVSRTMQALLGAPVAVEFVVEHADPEATEAPPLTLRAPVSGQKSRRAARPVS